jgi:hypothetical protein
MLGTTVALGTVFFYVLYNAAQQRGSWANPGCVQYTRGRSLAEKMMWWAKQRCDSNIVLKGLSNARNAAHHSGCLAYLSGVVHVAQKA